MTGAPLRVLLVEDNPDDAELILIELRAAGYEPDAERVDTPEAMAAALRDRAWDLVISDHTMPRFSAPAALRLLQERGLDLPFIIASGAIGEETAVAAMRAGAHDYILKQNLARLAPAIDRELREAGERARRRHLEQALHQAQKMEAVGRIAGGIAHDFGNMLTVVRGFAELIATSGRHDVCERHADQILKTTEHGETLLHQLLTFSRRTPVEPRVVDLNAELREIELMLVNLAGSAIRLELRLGEEVPPVLLDVGQLQQLIFNLVANSRDAMPRGGTIRIETGRATVAAGPFGRLQGGPFATLVVADTGHGMDAETIAHAFEPFFTTKPAGEGTGLGLASVYGIVQQAGGDIEIESAPGAGATFRITLPPAG